MTDGQSQPSGLPANAADLVQSYVVASRQTKRDNPMSLAPEIMLERRGYAYDDRWCVSWAGNVLYADGNWGMEPQPSERTEVFFAQTRFGLAEAFERARSGIEAARVLMGPPGQYLVNHLL